MTITTYNRNLLLHVLGYDNVTHVEVHGSGLELSSRPDPMIGFRKVHPGDDPVTFTNVNYVTVNAVNYVTVNSGKSTSSSDQNFFDI